MDAAVELAQAEQENEKLRADNADLKRLGIDCDDSERQLEWFRRQLFGRKSKKRGKKSFEGAADESGPGFGPDVPDGTVAIDNPEVAGIPESERRPVGEKVARRLAQTDRAFSIIRFVRQDVEATRRRRTRRLRPGSRLRERWRRG